jgi:adenylate cyclase class IV
MYFSIPNGRMKLREEKSFADGDLIYYFRPNRETSRISEYGIQKISRKDLPGFKNFLKKAFSILVVVKKTRDLYLFENMRIHLGQIDGLGNFLELETVLSKNSMSQWRKEHNEVAVKLELSQYEKIPVSYSDLLLKVR